MHKVPKYIDLFSGCGGLSLGLCTAGFQCVMAIESHRDAFETYRTNLIDTGIVGEEWPTWLEVEPYDLVHLVENHQEDLASLCGEIDLVAGGPPCQGFSMNGQRNPNDPRSLLVKTYLTVVEQIRPSLVLLENVHGFVSMKDSDGNTYVEVVQRRLDDLGYEVWDDVLRASHWGVPQSRPRYICIAAKRGSLPGINPFERLKTARRDFLKTRGLWPGPTTVRDAISDFELNGNPPPLDPEWGFKGFTAVERHTNWSENPYQRLMRSDAGEQPTDRRLARHSPEVVDRMRSILATCRKGVSLSLSARKCFGLGKRNIMPLDGQAPAPTVTTMPDDFIHYSEPRAMSVREHARLQSFPDWFSFRGPYTSGGSQRRRACPRYTQVGNAVPPLLAEGIGEILVGLLRDQDLP